jgi:hypothetical protein
MLSCGRSEAHTAGRLGCSKRRHARCSSNCTQGTPAGLPPGMPGIGVLIDGAMQQAAQSGRQFMGALSAVVEGVKR